MRKLILFLALIIPMAANAACNCPADDEEDDGTYHPYSFIGLKGGTNHASDSSIQNGSSNGYGIYAGSRYTKLFGVEAEYSFLGKFDTAAVASAHATAVSLSGVHYVDMGPISLYGKLGIAQTHTSLDGAGNKIDATFGVGLEANLNQDISMRLGYDHYRLKLPAGASGNDSITTLGIAYKY